MERLHMHIELVYCESVIHLTSGFSPRYSYNAPPVFLGSDKSSSLRALTRVEPSAFSPTVYMATLLIIACLALATIIHAVLSGRVDALTSEQYSPRRARHAPNAQSLLRSHNKNT
ncbi:hypothetical protein DAEQUDRAFT_319087 [Daedalea quercina L-15889]|uniref:Uncharacterized protein n=1 Tax=Daedalea quercina L-15889 TaxID=1314783 RepID=A0A165PXH0_9APHY|nr:hypothetical protein DAEQUDRAFT_319087 [Daedalea quercina L-15889]